MKTSTRRYEKKSYRKNETGSKLEELQLSRLNARKNRKKCEDSVHTVLEPDVRGDKFLDYFTAWLAETNRQKSLM